MSRKRRRPFKKRLIASPWALWPLAILFSLLVRAIYMTNRVERRMPHELMPYWQGERSAIYCFWHGRMILQPFIKPARRRMLVLMSQHRDGRAIGTVMHCFGIGNIPGSTSRGAAAALRRLVATAQAGHNMAITPDGPRGPFQQAAEGAAYVASRTGYAIIPVTFSCSRHRRLKTWDRFMFPLPFGKVCFVAAPAIEVAAIPTEAELRAATAALQSSLNRITEEADRACGVTA